MRLSDDLVELELEKIEEIMLICDTEAKRFFGKTYDAASNGRRTGLGTHGLADCIARLNLKYDSNEGIEIIKNYIRLLEYCLFNINLIGKTKGSFPVWDWNKESQTYI